MKSINITFFCVIFFYSYLKFFFFDNIQKIEKVKPLLWSISYGVSYIRIPILNRGLFYKPGGDRV